MRVWDTERVSAVFFYEDARLSKAFEHSNGDVTLADRDDDPITEGHMSVENTNVESSHQKQK